MYVESLGIERPEQDHKERLYDVTICETLKRTVSVRAASADKAHKKVEDGWKDGVYIIDADDFKDVHFSASIAQRVPEPSQAR
jgi:hypothetical protein